MPFQPVSSATIPPLGGRRAAREPLQPVSDAFFGVSAAWVGMLVPFQPVSAWAGVMPPTAINPAVSNPADHLAAILMG